MKIHLLRDHATPEQATEMLEELKTLIKLAVDIKLGIIAGGASGTRTVKKSCLKMEASKKTFGDPIGCQ